MSAKSNVIKKKSQVELRRLMQEHKTKVKAVSVTKKIDSPLAKYNDLGQLTCVLCKSVVRSETVWPIHINTKQHKGNIDKAKQLKEQTQNFTSAKRAADIPLANETPPNKIRGILKNSQTKETDLNQKNFVTEKQSVLPKDFFDTTNKNEFANAKNIHNKKEKESVNNNSNKSKDSEILPEGFFDDPKLDAKARNLEYRDPVEEEWEKFQKEIRDADNMSAAIIAEDQEEATTERQIDEIDEQMKNLSKVLDLEKKKVEVISATAEVSTKSNNEPEDENIDEENFDEFLDWRSKKSFK